MGFGGTIVGKMGEKGIGTGFCGGVGRAGTSAQSDEKS